MLEKITKAATFNPELVLNNLLIKILYSNKQRVKINKTTV